MNVTELARRVHMPTKRLREIMPHLGFDIGGRAIKVDSRIAQEVIQKLNSKAKRDKILKEVFGSEDDAETTEQKAVPEKKEGELQLPSQVMVKDLARDMNVNVTKLLVELMRQGVMVSLNDTIDYETAAIVGQDFGFTIVPATEESAHAQEQESIEELLQTSDSEQPQFRPPVVVVMGHVDHGKTKLLDAVRTADVAAGEHGGITQHIGAYQVEVQKTEALKDVPSNKLTFIDTPGHEAFSLMRSRGARIADLAILVVAADDGVQPQTIEAISHIKKAELPFVVAINKVDKPEANPDKIRTELAELGLNPEAWGGDTVMVEISALKRDNIDQLLETLLLVYEMHKDTIKADPEGRVLGTIVESHVTKGAGAVATVLVQNGTLKKGDQVLVGDVVGRIRSMTDWDGNNITAATPSMPAAVLGLKGAPRVGDILKTMDASERAARKTAKKMRKHIQSALASSASAKKEGAVVLNLIVKADVRGSLEALQESFGKLHLEQAQISVISQGLGYITEVDILRAVDTGALVVGFNAYPTPEAEVLARTHDVSVRSFKVIYDLLDHVSEEVSKRLSPEVVRNEQGTFRVLKVFRESKEGIIIGGKVLTGRVPADAQLELRRNGVFQGDGRIQELQSGRENVTEIIEGQEAGLCVAGFEEIEPGDEFIAYTQEEKERTVSL